MRTRTGTGVVPWILRWYSSNLIEENFDGIEAETGDMDTEEPQAKPGRPKLEDPQLYGDKVVKFVHNYIFSRGQGAHADASRLRATGEVFGAPLRSLAAAASAVGFPVSYSGIRMLHAPPKSSMQGRQHPRGVIHARPAANLKCVKLCELKRPYSISLKLTKQIPKDTTTF